MVVKARIGEMMKLHLEDLDSRKVDLETFQAAVRVKADQGQIKDVRRQLDVYHNTVDMLLAEVKAKLDLLNRDQSRTITMDTFAENYAPYLAKAEHVMNVERSLAMTLEQLISMQKQNKMYRADFDERLTRLQRQQADQLRQPLDSDSDLEGYRTRGLVLRRARSQ